MEKRAAVALAVACVLFVSLVTFAVLARRPSTHPQGHQLEKPSPVATKDQAGIYVPPRRIGKPAPDNLVVKAMEDSQLKTTFRNFRTAVATDNKHLQSALKPVLLKKKDEAMAIAQLEVDQAVSPGDRTISQKALEALRE